MTDTDTPVRCPRCGCHDVVVVTLTNFASGTAAVYLCDACAATSQRWVPKPAVVPTS